MEGESKEEKQDESLAVGFLLGKKPKTHSILWIREMEIRMGEGLQSN